MVLRLLFFSSVLFGVSSSVGGSGSGAGAAAFALLFAIMIAASAAAFFCCSRARRVLSATILPAATRFGFFMRAAVVGVGVGVVVCCVISTCECVVWVSSCEFALSDCSVDILKRSVYGKQIKLLCNYSEFVYKCSTVGEVC